MVVHPGRLAGLNSAAHDLVSEASAALVALVGRSPGQADLARPCCPRLMMLARAGALAILGAIAATR